MPRHYESASPPSATSSTQTQSGTTPVASGHQTGTKRTESAGKQLLFTKTIDRVPIVGGPVTIT